MDMDMDMGMGMGMDMGAPPPCPGLPLYPHTPVPWGCSWDATCATAAGPALTLSTMEVVLPADTKPSQVKSTLGATCLQVGRRAELKVRSSRCEAQGAKLKVRTARLEQRGWPQPSKGPARARLVTGWRPSC